jgi:hypothetical protein
MKRDLHVRAIHHFNSTQCTLLSHTVLSHHISLSQPPVIDKMDVNELADITNEPHRFNVPNPNNQNNEPPIFQNEEEKIVFEDEQENVEEVIDEDDSKED